VVTKEQQEQIDDYEICPKCLTPYDREDFITVYEACLMEAQLQVTQLMLVLSAIIVGMRSRFKWI